MSLLTKEQQKDIADIREINRLRHDLATGGEATKDVGKLLSIIDDLQSRHIERKQYTEQELRDLYFSTHRIDPFMSTWHSNRYSGWRECLTTIGALKAEP